MHCCPKRRILKLHFHIWFGIDWTGRFNWKLMSVWWQWQPILQRYIKQTIAISLLRACARVLWDRAALSHRAVLELSPGPRALKFAQCFLIWKSRKCPARNCLVGSEAGYCESAAHSLGQIFHGKEILSASRQKLASGRKEGGNQINVCVVCFHVDLFDFSEWERLNTMGRDVGLDTAQRHAFGWESRCVRKRVLFHKCNGRL